MDKPVVTALREWARHADAAAIAEGPRPSDLGGLRAVADASLDLAASPLFAYLVDVAANGDDPGGPVPDDARSQIDAAITGGFARHDRPSSYASAAARLLAHPALASRLGRPLEAALIGRAEQATTPGADPGAALIGAIAIETTLHMAATGVVKPHRLLAYLSDLAENVAAVPAQLSARLPRVTGIAHEQFGDDGLLALLERLLNVADAEPDAAFELALADLRLALDATSEEAVASAIARARHGLAAVADTTEARHDAQAYAAAIDAIMAFGRSDQAQMREATARLEQAVAQHRSWLAGMYSPPWNWTRAQAEAAWLQLSASLAAAAETLQAPCWYHPSQALTALLDAYQAGRAFTGRAGRETGIEILVRPAIEGAFIRDKGSLALLDHALAHDPELAGNAALRQLHEAVHQALNDQPASQAKPRGDGGAEGKALSRLPAVLSHFGVPRAADLVAAVPPELQDHIEAILWTERIARTHTGSIKLERLLGQLERDLSASPDWIPGIGPQFKMLLNQTLLFLDSRFDIGATMGGDRTAYLRSVPGTGPALERPFHQDYYEWLSQGPLYNLTRAEVIDIGGGRADVLVHFTGANFCVECKRELDDATPTALRAYAGQSSAYTATGPAFGILLVLDLATHAAGAPDLFSSVWIEQVQRAPEEHPRQIVVARLPGNRPAPSATPAPPASQQPAT